MWELRVGYFPELICIYQIDLFPFDLVCFGVLCRLYIMADPFDLVCFGVLCHLYIVAVSFIGGENRNTREKIHQPVASN